MAILVKFSPYLLRSFMAFARYFWGLMRMPTDPKSEANPAGHFVDEMARDTSGSTNGLAGRLCQESEFSERLARARFQSSISKLNEHACHA